MKINALEEEFLIGPNIDPKIDEPDYLTPPKSVSDAMLQSFYKNKLGYIGALTISMLQAGVNILTPYLLIRFIDGLDTEEEQTDKADSLFWLSLFAFAVLMNKALSTGREEILTPIGTQLANDLSKKVLRTYYAMPMQRYVSASNSPTVNMFGAAYGERAPRAFVNTLQGKAVPALIEMVAACVFISARFGPVGAIVSGALLMHVLSLHIGSKKIVEAQNIYMRNLYATFDHVITQIGQYTNVNIFNAAGLEMKRFSELLAKVDKMVDRSILIKSRALLAQSGLISSAAIMGTGLLAIHKPDQLSVEDLLWVLIYLSQLSPKFEILSEATNSILAEGEFFKSIIAHLHEFNHEESAHLAKLQVSRPTASIAFKNVSLTYANTQVLSDISFEVPAGKIVVITGESGAGKTSLFNLLQKFSAPTQGEILIAGQNINTSNTESVRDAFAVVPQSSVLQNDSLRANVRYANPAAFNPEIDAALKKAGLEEVLMRMQDDPIGLDGGKLSGGQQQRVAIARAYIRKAPILILDEFTSALDAKTETEMFEQLHALVTEEKATTILITHRLAALDYLPNIHEILVLKQGKIVEQGTKEALLENKDGLFYKQMQVAKAQKALASLDEDDITKKNDFKKK